MASTPSPAWRRNLFAVTAATFIGFTGFTLVMPFLPLYFRQLGVTDVGQIALYSGLSLGVTPALTALLSPLWGRLADRFGRKIMVERSLLSFVVIMAAMAYVTEAWHVVALRTVQGFFAGYGALALAMAADSAPPGKLAESIGTVQVAQRLGPALGPVLGGVVAEIAGLRNAFLIAAAFYAAGFVLVLVTYHEGPPQDGGAGEVDRQRDPARLTFRRVLGFPHFALLTGLLFVLQFADRSFGPVLPLYIAEHGADTERVALVSGVLFSLTAGFGALGNVLCARLLRRFTLRSVLIGGSMVGAAASLAYAASAALPVLAVASAGLGLGLGAAMTTVYTAAGSVIPAQVRGTAFGFLTSAALAGLAISPVVAGLLASISIRAVFLLDVLALVLSAAVIGRAMGRSSKEQAGGSRPPGPRN
jgi:MFS transporter, DHA1 family, multidrug resistance protein